MLGGACHVLQRDRRIEGTVGTRHSLRRRARSIASQSFSDSLCEVDKGRLADLLWSAAVFSPEFLNRGVQGGGVQSTSLEPRP